MLHRTLTAGAIALALAGPANAVGAGAGAKTTSARTIECKGSDGADARSATFLGRMRAVDGSDYMMMRFTLMEQFGDERVHPVSLPELRSWRQSKPGIKDFRYRQTVTGLHGGGEYRARIEFRWFDAGGNLIRKAQKISSPCVQPGTLANLTIGAVSAQSGAGGTAVYIVPVRNAGAADASGVAVELFVDGAATNVGRVDSIPAGQTREVRFTGPVCKRRVRAVADPADAITESLESDNVLNVRCPPVTG
jgi:hypothetical protein